MMLNAIANRDIEQATHTLLKCISNLTIEKWDSCCEFIKCLGLVKRKLNEWSSLTTPKLLL